MSDSTIPFPLQGGGSAATPRAAGAGKQPPAHGPMGRSLYASPSSPPCSAHAPAERLPPWPWLLRSSRSRIRRATHLRDLGFEVAQGPQRAAAGVQHRRDARSYSPGMLYGASRAHAEAGAGWKSDDNSISTCRPTPPPCSTSSRLRRLRPLQGPAPPLLPKFVVANAARSRPAQALARESPIDVVDSPVRPQPTA